MRLHFATSVFLILLYAVVGLTGESLHYVVQDAFRKGMKSDRASHEKDHAPGYFHCHGPDYHWHHHASHAAQPEHGADELHQQSKKRRLSRDRFGVYFQRPTEATHSPHACPLLALVASLRLGVGGFTDLEIDCQPLGRINFSYNVCLAHDRSQDNFARGPPQCFLA